MTRTKKKYEHYNILGAKYALPLIEAGGNKTKEKIIMESTILFAKNGYTALTMRELADAIGIKPASLYNYYKSKKDLWNSVLDHAIDLYKLYFTRLKETINNVQSFEEVVEAIFTEPKKMRNLFTCYAFTLIGGEQFRDNRAGNLYNGTFLEFSISFIKKCFDKCIDLKQTSQFDTFAAATIIMHAVLNAVSLKIQEEFGRNLPYDISEMLSGVQKVILQLPASQKG